MTQYLIKTTTHNTGELFHDVVKARENEVFTLVDAESEAEARERIENRDKGWTLGELIKLCFSLWAFSFGLYGLYELLKYLI